MLNVFAPLLVQQCSIGGAGRAEHDYSQLVTIQHTITISSVSMLLSKSKRLASLQQARIYGADGALKHRYWQTSTTAQTSEQAMHVDCSCYAMHGASAPTRRKKLFVSALASLLALQCYNQLILRPQICATTDGSHTHATQHQLEHTVPDPWRYTT
jgi:hypothetical protein